MAVIREFAERRQSALDNKAIEDGTQISIDELIDIPALEESTPDTPISDADTTEEELPITEEMAETTNIEWTEDT